MSFTSVSARESFFLQAPDHTRARGSLGPGSYDRPYKNEKAELLKAKLEANRVGGFHS
jgi:hypothetical protein